jgi:hypothetical protein
MRISFSRDGGFAGMRLATQIDTDSLLANDATDWEKLIRDANFFELPSSNQPEMAGADRFKYVVDVTKGNEHHRVEALDGAIPPSLESLIQQLLDAARMSRHR